MRFTRSVRNSSIGVSMYVEENENRRRAILRGQTGERKKERKGNGQARMRVCHVKFISLSHESSSFLSLSLSFFSPVFLFTPGNLGSFEINPRSCPTLSRPMDPHLFESYDIQATYGCTIPPRGEEIPLLDTLGPSNDDFHPSPSHVL